MLYVGYIDTTFLLFLFSIILFMMLFWIYAKAIEKTAFRKTIPASQLREGDVILESKIWDGLTKHQAEQLRKSNKKYTIKEGVRFGPVFLITIIITILYGNLFLLFLI